MPGVVAGGMILGGMLSVAYGWLAREGPDLASYPTPALAETSVVYDAEGNPIDELHGDENRRVVGYEEMAPALGDAVVAVEDHRFYEHDGVDLGGIGRAAYANLRNASILQGGSTITQQLVKNTYIAEGERRKASLSRKLDEAMLAVQYEETHTKEEILERYLNTVYFGGGAYGAEAASHAYFDKSASELEQHEAALLAGVLNLPDVYDPFADPESARKRRDVVLDKMLQYGYLSGQEHDAAIGQELGVSRGKDPGAEGEEEGRGYFLDAVRRELVSRYGEETLYEGGLEIQTTLDPGLQEAAYEAVDGVVDPAGSADPSAALVSVEPETGAVRAMVGGQDHASAPFNLATQARRQPGSVFKAFVLAAAIREGVSPEEVYESRDFTIDMGGGEEREIRNYGGVERGRIPLSTATEQSDNTAFVRLAMKLGLKKVSKMAAELGIASDLGGQPTMAIGGTEGGVTPLEMASAYGTFENAGTRVEPYLVEKVSRQVDGAESTAERHESEGRAVLSREQAAAVTDVLRGVVERGTPSTRRDVGEEIGRASAGKTGTTDEFVDAWYVGYVPGLATSVWVGYPDERKPMVNVRGHPRIEGENFPLDIWTAYMSQAGGELPEEEFEEPPANEATTATGGTTGAGKTGGEATAEATEAIKKQRGKADGGASSAAKEDTTGAGKGPRARGRLGETRGRGVRRTPSDPPWGVARAGEGGVGGGPRGYAGGGRSGLL